MNLLQLNNNNKIKTVGIKEKRETQKVVYTKSSDWTIAELQKRLYENAIEVIEGVIAKDGKVSDIDYISKHRLTNYRIQFASGNNYIHIVDKASGYKYATISLGNEKLKSNEYRLFVIFNIIQRITCINATKDCLKFCYANKSNNNVNVENSSSRNSRITNTVFAMFSNFDEIINEVIEFVRTYTNRDVVFRLHESGDVFSRNYWEKIKRVMDVNTDIKFMFYTKSVFVLNELNEVNSKDNVSIRYSLDGSSNIALVKKCNDEKILTFSAIGKGQTLELATTVNERYICNMASLPTCEDLAKIESLEIELIEEKRKTYKKKIETEINKIKDAIIEKNQKCTNCLKCFNKENISMFAFIH